MNAARHVIMHCTPQLIFAHWPRNRTGTGNRNRRNRFCRNRTRNRNRRNRSPATETGTGTVLSCQTVLKHTKTPSLEEPPEPKTGTARTVLSPNRNRTEPNRGHPDFCSLVMQLQDHHYGPLYGHVFSAWNRVHKHT